MTKACACGDSGDFLSHRQLAGALCFEKKRVQVQISRAVEKEQLLSGTTMIIIVIIVIILLYLLHDQYMYAGPSKPKTACMTGPGSGVEMWYIETFKKLHADYHTRCLGAEVQLTKQMTNDVRNKNPTESFS